MGSMGKKDRYDELRLSMRVGAKVERMNIIQLPASDEGALYDSFFIYLIVYGS